MSAKHTPGPWVFSFEVVDPEWAIVTTIGGSVIANVNADHRQEANARLIAAAPEMSALLKEICGQTGFQNLTVGPGSAHERIAAVLAKTEGRQP